MVCLLAYDAAANGAALRSPDGKCALAILQNGQALADFLIHLAARYGFQVANDIREAMCVV